MSYLAFVVLFLAGEAVLVVLSQPSTGVCGGIFCLSDSDCGPNQRCQPSQCGSKLCTAVVPPLTCATILCAEGTFCRNVTACSTCPIEAKCIPIAENTDGLDNECRRLSYTEVILSENPANRTDYIPLTCGGYEKCPAGSDCIGGYCCNVKVSTPLTKSGLCPENNVTICKADLCNNDYECPGEQKCCNGCGKVCQDPIFVRASGDGCENTRCERGEVCVLRTPSCAPGFACIQVFLPVCVPRQCARCADNESCRNTGYGYACSRTDECGGCPRGQVCRPTGLVCVTTPCNGAYACVPIDRCGGCPRGQDCRLNSCRRSTCGSYKCYPNKP